MFPTSGTVRTARKDLSRCNRAIRGFRTPNTHCEMSSLAMGLAVQTKPIPAVVEYDQWLATVTKSERGRQFAMSGAKLRRAVIMVRNGCPKNEIGRSIGCGGAAVARWLHKLPSELAP